MTKITKAKYLALLNEPTDTRKGRWRREARGVREMCRWLDRAGEFYGVGRIERQLARLDVGGPVYVATWRRWRQGDSLRVVPFGVISEPEFPQFNLGPALAVAPRVAAFA